MHQRLFPDPFLILINNPKKPFHARNSFINFWKYILKEDYQKALKKFISFFLSDQVPFNGQSYLKQKGPGTNDQSLFRLQNEFRKVPLLVIYYLTKFDDIISSGFWVIPKITSANLCKPIHDIINIPLRFVLLSLENVEKKGKKYKNVNISRTKRAF